MNSKQKRVLALIFADPVSGTIPWADIESLFGALGYRTVEDAGLVSASPRTG